MELLPALGMETGLQLVQQASMMGGCDFVLVHPEFLQDRTQNGLLMRYEAGVQLVGEACRTPSSMQMSIRP